MSTAAADIEALATRVRAFVKAEIVPFEVDPRWGEHGPGDDLRRECVQWGQLEFQSALANVAGRAEDC